MIISVGKQGIYARYATNFSSILLVQRAFFAKLLIQLFAGFFLNCFIANSKLTQRSLESPLQPNPFHKFVSIMRF